MKDARVYLADMLEHGRRIARYTSGGKAEFLANPMVRDAVLRNFEVIGEAAAQVPHELRARYSEIPWRRVIGFRNVLIHGYHGVVPERVWQTVEHELPVLLAKLEDALRAEGIDPSDVP